MFKRSLLFILINLFAATAFAQEADTAGGFGVSLGPSLMRFQGAPGVSQSGKVKVWNKSGAPMKFIVEIFDVGNEVNKEGVLNRIFPPAGTLPYSCAKWILPEDKEFIVQPGESRETNILVSAPSDAEGGKSAVVFFTGAAVEEETGGKDRVAGVQIMPRLGVLIFFDIAGTVKRNASLSDFSVTPPTDGSPLKLQYVFENQGNADILLGGTYYVLNEEKALALKENINVMRTFQGDRGRGETVWQGDLPPGNYHLVATFELGPETEEVIVQEKDFTVP